MERWRDGGRERGRAAWKNSGRKSCVVACGKEACEEGGGEGVCVCRDNGWRWEGVLRRRVEEEGQVIIVNECYKT